VGVRDVNANGDGIRGSDVRLVDSDRPVLEGGVALAVAEGVPGEGAAEDILVAEDEGAVWQLVARVADGAGGVEVVVVDGKVADIGGEADGELAGGVVVAEEDVGEGVAAFLGGVELLDQCGGRVGEPGLCDGLAAAEDDDGGDAGVDDGFDEGGLGADEGEVIYVDVFAGSARGLVRDAGDLFAEGDSRCVEPLPQLHLVSRPCANDDNGHVGFLRCLDGLGEAGLVVAPALASLGVVDVCLLTNRGLDAVQGSDAPVLALVDHVISVLIIMSNVIHVMSFAEALTFMNPWAMGPITAMSPFFFRGSVLLWFSSRTMDSLSNCLASLTASLLWMSLFH
jgi:hypothetical protein